MNGRLLLVGGAADMGGAIRIAAEAALRAGVGLVYVATHPDSVAAVVAGRPEVICRGVQAPGDMADWLDVADAIAVGPGLGQGSSARLLLDAVLNARQPVVVDADGLNLIAGLGLRRDNWIVTPHPAEAGRLLGTSAQQVQADRLGAVQELAKELNAIAVLKGACSLIGQLTDTEDFSISVCDYGNPGMASPGMGDLLTGIIGALIAQGSPLPAAARIGVLVHALAGDTAAGSAERGLLASDLLPEIRRLVNP